LKPLVLGLLAVLFGAGGCATVQADNRAALADPLMQVGCEPRSEALRGKGLEIHDGATGGHTVALGGRPCK
jgi:hypothetical protein